MPTIKIDDLHPTGAELFSDSESYLNELGDGELDLINGGTGFLIRSAIKGSRAVGRSIKAGYDASKRFAKNAYVKTVVRSVEIATAVSQISNPFNSI
jgi:hypothetical protein